MKNKKTIIYISLIVFLLIVGAIGMIVISKLSNESTKEPTSTTTETTTITTTSSEISIDESQDEEPTNEEVKSTTTSTTLKVDTSSIKKTTTTTKKDQSKTTTNKTTSNTKQESTTTKADPVCKKYSLPKGAVLMKDFGENGISGMSSEFFNAFSDAGSFVDGKLESVNQEVESWFEHDSGARSMGSPMVAYCSDGYTVRGIYTHVIVYICGATIEGYMKPNGSVSWINKNSLTIGEGYEHCQLKKTN